MKFRLVMYQPENCNTYSASVRVRNVFFSSMIIQKDKIMPRLIILFMFTGYYFPLVKIVTFFRFLWIIQDIASGKTASVQHWQNSDWNFLISLRESHLLQQCSRICLTFCTEKTIIPFPFKLNGIWSWWQFSIRFWTKWKTIWFKIVRKTVNNGSGKGKKIHQHSIWGYIFKNILRVEMGIIKAATVQICRQ